MADRLAASGYSVLVVNPYYRDQRAPVLPEGATSQDPGIMETLRPMLASLSTETNVTDAIALIEYLDAQEVVDSARKLGTTGYCLGGPNTFRTAAEFPDRIGAVGSFHGIRLVTDEPDSPHRLVPNTQAEYLVAIAEDDDQREPQAKHALRESFDGAGVPAEVEVYEDALHSWCTPDSHVYNEAQAERMEPYAGDVRAGVSMNLRRRRSSSERHGIGTRGKSELP